MRSLAILLLVAAGTPAQAGASTARAAAESARSAGSSPVWAILHEEARVRGLVLELGDIAEVDGLDPARVARARRVPLGPAPAPGEGRLLSRGSVAELLARQGAPASGITLKGASATRIIAETVGLSSEEIVTLARLWLAEALGPKSRETRVELTRPPAELVANAGRFTNGFDVVRLESPGTSSLVSLAVRALVDATPSVQTTVQLMLRRELPVLVAKETLYANQPVKPEQVVLELREVSGAGAGTLDDPADLRGLLLRNRVAAGHILTARDFQQAPVVLRNAPVRVEVRSGNLVISGDGVALADGAPGERIPVRTHPGKRLVHATVIDSRLVVVDLAPSKGNLP